MIPTALAALVLTLPPPGAVARVVEQHSSALVVSSDGKTLAVRVKDGFDLIDLGTGKAVPLRDTSGERFLDAKKVRDSGDSQLAFFPDGETVATVNHEKRVSIWDAATGKHLRDVDTPKLFNVRPEAVQVFGCPHLKGVVVGLREVPLGLLTAKDEYTVLAPSYGGWPTHVTPGGRWISGVERQSSVEDLFYVTDVTAKGSGKKGGHFDGSVGQGDMAGVVATSTDGKWVAASLWASQPERQEVKLFKYETAEEVKLTDPGKLTDISALDFSSDRKTLWAAGESVIARWDTTTGKRAKDVPLPKKGAAVAFDPSRDRAIVCGGGWVWVVELK